MVVSAFPQSLPVSLPFIGMMEPSFATRDRPRVSSSEHLGDTSCCLPVGQFPCVSKLVNPSVFSSFRGITASFKANCGTTHVLSGAAVAAVEARQKCRGLKRNRSLQRHQGAQFFQHPQVVKDFSRFCISFIHQDVATELGQEVSHRQHTRVPNYSLFLLIAQLQKQGAD